jgi:hypothetical protein
MRRKGFILCDVLSIPPARFCPGPSSCTTPSGSSRDEYYDRSRTTACGDRLFAGLHPCRIHLQLGAIDRTMRNRRRALSRVIPMPSKDNPRHHLLSEPSEPDRDCSVSEQQ